MAIVVGAGYAWDVYSWKMMVRRAAETENSGKVDASLAIWARALERKPESQAANAAYRRLLRQVKSLPPTTTEVWESLNRALDRDPENHEARRSAALAAWRLGRIDQARSLYQVVAHQDTSSVAIIEAADALAELAKAPEHLTEALTAYELAADSSSGNNAELMRRRAMNLALALGLWERALPQARALLEKSPNDGELEGTIGLCCARLNRFSDALVSLELTNRHAPDRIEFFALRAEVLRDRLKREREARDVLDAMVSANPKSFRAYLARARPSFRDDPKRAGADLETAFGLAPKEPSVVLAYAEWLAFEGHRDRAREVLETAWKARPEEISIAQARVSLEFREGRTETALNILRETVRARPGAMALRFNLAGLLFDIGEIEEAEELTKGLRVEELEPGLAPLLEGRRRIAARRWPDAIQTLEEALPAVSHQPDLAVAFALLLAKCYDATADREAQLLSYRRARAFAPTSLAAVEGEVEALIHLERYTEAMTLARILAPHQTKSRAMLAEALLRQRERQSEETPWNEVEAAVADVERTAPKSFAALRLRAEFLAARGQAAAALALVDETARREPGRADVALALLRTELLARLKNVESAEAAAREAAKQGATETQTTAALARGWERGGSPELAARAWGDLARRFPGDPAIARAWVETLLKNRRWGDAEPVLRHHLAAGRTWAWLRKGLARCLAASGGRRGVNEALTLVNANLARDHSDPADLSLKAHLILGIPERRREAIEFYQELPRDSRLSEEGRVLLARLYRAEGMEAEAGEVLRELLVFRPKHVPYLKELIDGALRERNPGRVNPYMSTLESLTGDHPDMIERKARWLHLSGRRDESARLTETLVDRPGVDPGRVAALFESIEQYDRSEALYRHRVQAPGGPATELDLVLFLARRGKTREALNVLLQGGSQRPAGDLASGLAAILVEAPTADDVARIASKLEGDRTAESAESPLWLPLALLRVIQGRDADAEKIYRLVLERAPENIMALNNLAFLLSGRAGGASEAMGLVEKAIGLVGPDPALRDTRGLIRLAQGRVDSALEDFSATLARTGEQPLTVLHLAYAQDQAAQGIEAVKTLNRAIALGLERKTLSAAEQKMVKHLRK